MTQNEIKGERGKPNIHCAPVSSQGIDKSPEAADADVLMSKTKTHSKANADFSSSELKGVDRGRLQKVAQGAIVGEGA